MTWHSQESLHRVILLLTAGDIVIDYCCSTFSVLYWFSCTTLFSFQDTNRFLDNARVHCVARTTFSNFNSWRCRYQGLSNYSCC